MRDRQRERVGRPGAARRHHPPHRDAGQDVGKPIAAAFDLTAVPLVAGWAEPLPHSTRRHMESCFGVDFGSVRMRESPTDASTTGVLASTSGQEITFARGMFAPGTPDGDRLIAHELAHTVQQQAPAAGGSAASDGFAEREADVAAAAAMTGAPVAALAGRPGRRRQHQERRPPFPVVEESLAGDRDRRFKDPADGRIKPVWTPDDGYVKNPSARPLMEVIEGGRIGGSFKNGNFIYVVDSDGKVILGARLGERGGGRGRATGMPHPSLIGGKNPTVLAAGEVEIQGGKIFRIDNQSGHFRPGRKAVGTAVKAFLRAPTTAFHPDFGAESVHYDTGGARVTRSFRSLEMLKLRSYDLKRALRALRPRTLAGRMRSRSFRSGARTAGGALAGALAMIALQYLLGKWMDKINNELVDQQIEKLAPEIESRFASRGDELDALLEADSEADVFVNVRFGISTVSTPVAEGDKPMMVEGPPLVELVAVGFSRQPWDSTPVERTEINCFSTIRTTTVSVSEAVSPKELFTDEQTVTGPVDTGQPEGR